jgi:predicted nucleic acid-binding protein
VLTVRWVDADLHGRAVSALLAADRREVSLVDWTSFEMMRSRGVEAAFAYDDDFGAQGFTRFV